MLGSKLYIVYRNRPISNSAHVVAHKTYSYYNNFDKIFIVVRIFGGLVLYPGNYNDCEWV